MGGWADKTKVIKKVELYHYRFLHAQFQLQLQLLLRLDLFLDLKGETKKNSLNLRISFCLISAATNMIVSFEKLDP